jgi:two-component system phosphate regulon sensor histidine kinase PhoR
VEPIIIMLILSFSFLVSPVISAYYDSHCTDENTHRASRMEIMTNARLRTDEIEDLSAAMADMADVIKRNIADITEKNSRMQAIFKAVPGGVLAIDNHETVTMVNPAAQEMFSISQKPEGRHFMEVVRHAKLESVIRESLDKQAPVEREIIMQKGMEERFLHVIAVPVAGAGIAYGVILLAQDITRIRKLENMRSDFAANVSHELKTPLTVISGFIDTLKDPGISRKDTERFLEIISLESERLTRLIDDVLALSEIENTAVPPASVLDVRQSVREAAELLQNSAQLRHISLTLDTAKCRIPIAADNDRIKQMMIILIDNAIKYTPEGGSVHVSAEKKARSCVIRVADTEIGRASCRERVCQYV